MNTSEKHDEQPEMQLQAASPESTDQNAETNPIVERLRHYYSRWLKAVDWAGSKIAPITENVEDSPESMAKKAIRVGMWSFVIIFGVFGLWSVTAPIDSAAVATGSVILDSNKKTVQHLEGGIIDKIFVREGQFVKKGEPLVRLDETTAKARYDLLKSQYIAAKATEARLLAERDGLDEIPFDQELLALEKKNAIVDDNLDSQRRLFKSRRKNLEGQTSVLRQKIEQHREEIKGLESQIESAEQQLALLADEIQGVRKLYNNGQLVSKQRLRALERQEAAIRGELGNYKAMISRAEQSIGEAEIQILNLKNEFSNEVVQELKETQVSLSDLEERIRASADTVNRIMITAPLDGTVTDLQVHTVGGVISPGDKIMDIVPQDDKLIVEAKVQPQDIDVVHSGLRATVRLSAYRVRMVPPVDGMVKTVSADKFVDDRSGESYYLARIEIDNEQLAGLEDVNLYPGMPTEVLIVTGARTLANYLMAPITDSFNRALREQ
jgi:HlyD family type I secretion membrane fusion protein